MESELYSAAPAPASSPSMSFLTGPAGSGKTFHIQSRIRERPSFGVLCATTGIAAVNLGEGVTTLHSLLKFFDYPSLVDSYMSGRLHRELVRVSEEHSAKHIIIDEVSMLDGRMLQILVNALLEVNEKVSLGMILTGDFCQLPPVKAPWAFETTDEKGRVIPSPVWRDYFAPNVVRLTKVWRQNDPAFLEALNAFRRGEGSRGAEALAGCQVRFADTIDLRFDGSTLLAKNEEVDRFNLLRLNSLSSTPFTLSSRRWAREPGMLHQWKDIPERLTLKEGALVIILANHPPDFEYVNGDLAEVLGFSREQGALLLKLKRNGEEIRLRPLLRKLHQRETPEGLKGVRPRPLSKTEAEKATGGKESSYWDSGAGKWVVGEILYYPVRLGWATTVHKSQGLSLDRVQVDARNGFFGHPAMCYVSLSRCRRPEGLRIIGSPKLLAERCRIDGKIREWI